MTEKAYSKREQDHYQTDMKNRMDAQDQKLDKILEQTTKTNGRVTKSEDKIVALENNQRQRRQDLVWAVGILLTITIFLFNYLK